MRILSIIMFLVVAISSARSQAVVHGADAVGFVNELDCSLQLSFDDGSQPLVLIFSEVSYSPKLDLKIGYYKQVAVAQWKLDGTNVWLINGLDCFLLSGFDMCVEGGFDEKSCAKIWKQN